LEAENEAAAAQELRQRQFLPVEIRPLPAARLPTRRPRLFLRRPKSGDLAFFCRQFATLVGAGVPVVPGLRALAEQTANRALKAALRGVVARVEAGSALAEALEAFPEAFPPLMVRMAAAGEVGGVLDEVLERLAVHYEREHEFYQKLRSAITYPAFVLLAALGVVIFLFFYVLPTFGRMLAGLNVSLPLPTLIVLGVGEAGRRYWYLFVLVPVLAAAAIRQYRQTARGREWWDRLLLRLPVLGGLYRQVTISRFSRTLGTLLRGGVPLLQALEVVRGVMGNVVLEQGVVQVQESIRRGQGMAEPLGRTGLFPPMVTQMIAVGEESGALDALLERVSLFYDREVDAAVSRLASLVEPILILFLGGVVGVVVVAVLLPMLTIVQSVR
jgi:type IV pilus assembly protein PilC